MLGRVFELGAERPEFKSPLGSSADLGLGAKMQPELFHMVVA